jgi:hypothetical protein
MNANFDRHCPNDDWEDYALGMLSEEACELLEQHLLFCSACQDLLAEVDEYIRVTRAVLAISELRLAETSPSSLILLSRDPAQAALSPHGVTCMRAPMRFVDSETC